ncbi:MAG: chemotaxis protein MotD [Bradyrhizobiaceae bacterium PARB1]|jgi:chemotaxis protein MotD|nr:MAG: chemotaxis protein MotD [Bradyrhizobiaceae bacterium PARB1]
MKQADLLTAAFHQLASTKAGGKGGLNGALHSKDGKEKAEHFREQMRQVAKDKPPVVPKIEKNVTHVATAPVLDAAAILAELSGEVKPKPVAAEQPEKEEDAPQSTSDGKQATATTHDWRDPNAALSAVMSKLDPAQRDTARDDKPAQPSSLPQAAPKIEDKSPESTNVITAPDIDAPDIDAGASKRFTATVESVDTKPVLASKPVVREQETHFEPVQQVTTLQKIVDRMASDLPAVASAEGPLSTTASSQETVKPAESRPVRMMTLELDPPNLGSVTIKMRLAGDSVEVHLTADRLETTHLLRQERGALTDAMQSAGYSFDIAAIDHTRTADANINNGQSQSQPQQQHASSDQRSSMPSPNGAQTDGGSSGRSSSDGQGGARHNRQDHDQSHTPSEHPQDQGVRHIRSSTVYL